MSTRSEIFYFSNGELKSSYCHYDGYLEGVGATLFKYYQDPSKVKKLIALGDLSHLDKEVSTTDDSHSFDTPVEGITVAYGRDRGESDVEPVTRYYNPKNVGELLKYVHGSSSQEYSYVYIQSEKKWFYIDVWDGNGKGELLSKALGKEDPTNKQSKQKPKQTKNYITREDSVKVARELRKKPAVFYVLLKVTDGKFKNTFVNVENANRPDAVARFNWVEFGLEYQGKATQAILADYIYKKINYEVSR